MKTSVLLWIVMGGIVVTTLFLTFEAGNLETMQAVGNVAKSAAEPYGGMVGSC